MKSKRHCDDATADRYDTFFYAAFTGDLLPKLNVKLDRNFIPGTDYYMHWDKEEKKGTTAEELRYAMTRRPGMRAFFANGWFDLCTEFGYAWHTMIMLDFLVIVYSGKDTKVDI